MADQQFVDFIDMRLHDPELEAWDGRSSRLDPGFYDFEVEKASIDQSKKGNPTLALTLKVVSEGPMRGATKRQSYAIMPDNDASRRRMKSLITALGAATDPEGRFSATSLVGLRFSAEVISQTYDDVDPRTGQPVVKQSTNIVGEKTYEGEQVAAATGKPVTAPVAQRRPAPAPAPNGPVVRR